MKPKDDPAQLLIFADVTSNGNGGFLVTPRKPVAEVGPAEAAKILNVAVRSLGNLLERPLAQKLIKWRWTSDACGKRLFETQSLTEYRKATRDPELQKGSRARELRMQ